MTQWHLYIIRTRNGDLYTGITTDVDRRFAEHQAGGVKAAKYLRGRGPLTLVFSELVGSRSAVSKAEWAVKQLSKEDKEALVAKRLSLDMLLLNPYGAARLPGWNTAANCSEYDTE